MIERTPMRLLIPAGITVQFGEKRALMAEWAAGSAFIMRGQTPFDLPATVERACAWNWRYRGAIKGRI